MQIAYAFAKEGATVIVASRSKDKVDRITTKLNKIGKGAGLVLDITSQEKVEKAVAQVEEEFAANSTRLIPMSDDGSWGGKGLVTDALRRLLESGQRYDEVITIGPLPMMKFVCILTKEFGVKTIASMNPIMIDSTGMCGGCRLTVGGKTKFACVDGPEFDGHEIDFDEAISRSRMYAGFEKHAYGEACRLAAGK